MILPINKAYYHNLNSLGILKTVDEIIREVLNGPGEMVMRESRD